MKKKTNHKLVTRQNKTSEPVDKTEEQNPGEDGRMRLSAENGDRAGLKNKAGRACGPEEDARKLCPRMKKLSEAFFDGQDVVQ